MNAEFVRAWEVNQKRDVEWGTQALPLVVTSIEEVGEVDWYGSNMFPEHIEGGSIVGG